MLFEYFNVVGLNSKIVEENPTSSSQPSVPVEKSCVDFFIADNNLSASIVIGQVDFISNSANQGGAVGTNTVSGPNGFYS